MKISLDNVLIIVAVIYLIVSIFGRIEQRKEEREKQEIIGKLEAYRENCQQDENCGLYTAINLIKEQSTQQVEAYKQTLLTSLDDLYNAMNPEERAGKWFGKEWAKKVIESHNPA